MLSDAQYIESQIYHQSQIQEKLREQNSADIIYIHKGQQIKRE